jgi:hypothetical protein
VFADVTDDMRIARAEIFGPVLSILKCPYAILAGRIFRRTKGRTASALGRDVTASRRRGNWAYRVCAVLAQKGSGPYCGARFGELVKRKSRRSAPMFEIYEVPIEHAGIMGGWRRSERRTRQSDMGR